MLRGIRFLLFLSALLLTLGVAQTQLNFLAVDGELLESDAGPYYFTEYGDSQTAYIRSSHLAAALGATVAYNADEGVLIFRLDGRSVRVRVTSDARAALSGRSDALVVEGEVRDGPTGILAGGVSYVPLVPVARALRAEVEWDSGYQTIYIDSYQPPAPQEASEPSQEVVSSLGLNGQGTPVGTPRVAVHDGFTRVALDLPEGTSYQVQVNDNTMMIVLPGLTASSYSLNRNDTHLQDVRFASANGELALVIQATHPLSADGRGYRVGLLPASDSKPEEVLYVDLGPDQRGQSVAALEANLEALASDGVGPAAVRVPQGGRRSVVIDPGHGGIFAGAQGYAREEAVVLDIALKLKQILEANGVDVILTRNTNTQLGRSLRDDLRARAQMATTDRNLFVSIHANAAANSQAHGIETWVFGQPLDAETRQRAVRENGGGTTGRIMTDEAITYLNSVVGDILVEEQLKLSHSLAEMVQSRMVASTGARDRGVKQSAFFVLRQSRIPAVLVEVGFVTNPHEGQQLNSSSYQATLADAIARGVLEFFEQGGSVAQR